MFSILFDVKALSILRMPIFSCKLAIFQSLTKWCLVQPSGTVFNFQKLCEFFETIKNRIGMIIADDSEQFLNSCKTVFSKDLLKVLCTVHVDSAWSGTLSSKVVSGISFRTVAQDPDERLFNQMQQI